MSGWRDEALDEIAALNPRLVEKWCWRPSVAVADDHVDLFVWLRRRSEGRDYVLRLQYLPDWASAGRREDFVDPADFARAGQDYWPRNVEGVNWNYQPQPGRVVPAICLKGVFGYHSVLHRGELMQGATLSRFLRELQGVMSR